MKRCSMCGEVKAVSEFHRYARTKGDGYQAYCKACRKTYDHEYHLRVRDRRMDQKRQARLERRKWLQELRGGQPCTDCGNVFPVVVMQWDHLPGTEKLGDISGNLFNHARATILAEIAKCELVCANCHALRTFRRRHGVAEDATTYVHVQVEAVGVARLERAA